MAFAQDAAPVGPQAVIEVETTYSFWTFLLAFTKPRIAVNGQASIVRWGVTSIPVVPGRYQIEVWTHYLLYSQMGRNSVVVDVVPGTCTRIHWKGPWAAFTKGPIRVVSVTAFDPSAVPQAPSAPAPSAAVQAGSWHPDPTGRHELRYFDGAQWTEHVSSAGVAGTDRLDG